MKNRDRRRTSEAVRVGISHDGYEHYLCPEHGFDSACDCEDREWCFIARNGDKIVYRLTRSELLSHIPAYKSKEIEDFLLMGIGLYLLSLEEIEIIKQPVVPEIETVAGGVGQEQTALQKITGKWPGDETIETILGTLKGGDMGILERIQILHECEWLEEHIKELKEPAARFLVPIKVIRSGQMKIYQELLDRLLTAYPEVMQIRQQLEDAGRKS